MRFAVLSVVLLFIFNIYQVQFILLCLVLLTD